MSESLLDRGIPNDMDRQGEIPPMSLHTPGCNPIGSADNSGPYLSMIPPDNVDMNLNIPYMESNAPLANPVNNQDPYLDDDVLQEEYSVNFQRQVPRPMVADHIRSVYNKGAYGNMSKGMRESSPFLEGSSYSNMSNRSSVDFSSSYPDSHSVPHNISSPRPPYNPPLSEEGGDDGLFIESMPAIANDNYVNRMYGGPSLDADESFSPRPFDMPQPYSFYQESEPINPELRRSMGGSMGFFRDGGVGIGARSYHRSLISEPDGWVRTRSLNRNMDSMGGYGSLGQVSRSSYGSLRPSSLQHASQPTLNDMNLGMEFGSLHDLSFSNKMPPHHVSSFEHIPNEFPQNPGYLGHRGMPNNRSYMDSLGLLEESDLPMARAKSMMYLGEADDIDVNGPLPYDGYYLPSQPRPPEASLSDLPKPRSELLPKAEGKMDPKADPLSLSALPPPQSLPQSQSSQPAMASQQGQSAISSMPPMPPMSSQQVQQVQQAQQVQQTQQGVELKKEASPVLEPSLSPTDASVHSPAEVAIERQPDKPDKPDAKDTKDAKPGRNPTSPQLDWRYRHNRSPQPFGDRPKSPRPSQGSQGYSDRSKSPRPSMGSMGSQSPKPMQERSKSPMSRSPAEGDRVRVMVHGKYRFACRDFEKGVCSRGAACKFYHDPAKAVTTPDKIPVCRDFSKGKCTRDNCRFRHPGTHKDNVLMGLEEPASPSELDMIMKQYSSTIKPRNVIG